MIRFFTESNIFIAICASSFYFFYSYFLENIESTNVIFIFLATLATYNYLQKKELIKVLIPLFLSFFFILELAHLYTYVLGFLITLAYEYKLRSIYYLKPVAIALVWILLLDISLLIRYPVVFLEGFILIIALTLPFDIRDKDSDQRIRTLVHVLGEKKLKYIIICLLISSLILKYFFLEEKLTLLYLASLSSLFIIFLFKSSLKDYKVAFFTDGLILTQVLALAL